MNKRQKSAIETKRKLISAGLELIKEKGFDAINVEDITKKAGVAKGTFYVLFQTQRRYCYGNQQNTFRRNC